MDVTVDVRVVGNRLFVGSVGDRRSENPRLYEPGADPRVEGMAEVLAQPVQMQRLPASARERSQPSGRARRRHAASSTKR